MSPAAGTLTARRVATRARLLDGARAVFAERGVAGATVEDICEAAGFTRGAFYSNFETKDELLLALMDTEQERTLANLAAAVGEGSPAGEGSPGQDRVAELGGVLDLFLAAQPMDRQWALMVSEFELAAMRNPELAASLTAAKQEFETRLAELVVAALAAVGRRLRIEPAEAVQLLQGTWLAAIRSDLIARSGGAGDAAPRVPAVMLALVTAISEPLPARPAAARSS